MERESIAQSGLAGQALLTGSGPLTGLELTGLELTGLELTGARLLADL